MPSEGQSPPGAVAFLTLEDGNKRVAFFAVDVFLRINGFHIAVDADDAHQKIIQVIEKGTDVKESLETFLRQYTVES